MIAQPISEVAVAMLGFVTSRLAAFGKEGPGGHQLLQIGGQASPLWETTVL